MWITLRRPRRLSTRVGNLLTATSAEMNSSSHELCAPVVNNVYVKEIYLPYAEIVDGSGINHSTDVKSAGFQSWLEASHVYRPSEEIWYNETVCPWMTIYIYIYIYIYRPFDIAHTQTHTHTPYIYIYICVCVCVCVSDWRLSQPGFVPSYGKLVCLATLMSSDRTKQICLWMTIYIYIYNVFNHYSLWKWIRA